MEEVLTLTGMTEKANHWVKTYFGGMKRRVNIAVGLLHRNASHSCRATPRNRSNMIRAQIHLPGN